MERSAVISSVLVANRGEIAVRIIRAAYDDGLRSIAVYADPDAESLFVQLADVAIPLRGTSPTETYLDIDKIINAARSSGADAVHPGYGFLAENATFAQAVIDAGLIWIGPPPSAIASLGDKVQARRIAEKVGAPLAPGTTYPLADAAEAVAFADQNGLPIAIKAAYGGGGRGIKIADRIDNVATQYEAAVREAVAAFGRGECFVEKYLERPRHVETQCLADQHGNVVVVSTRDCSLQRRHQKLVEEAPAPFLNRIQKEQLYSSSKAILREAGYVGAGTCEFLLARDGTLSFLEVNTRLQVEHPVSEQVTGLDLVHEMFRIAAGAELGYDDPTPWGHSIEFRINAEDPAHGFLPTPGRLTRWRPALGPGIRVDEAYLAGMSVPPQFDSLIAKLIVTGATRAEALRRSRRALQEMSIEGIATTIPFHQAILDDPTFTAPVDDFAIHTRWIETSLDLTARQERKPHPRPSWSPTPRYVEVSGKRLQAKVSAGADLVTDPTAAAGRAGDAWDPDRANAMLAQQSPDALVAPMDGTIVKIAVRAGDQVKHGDLIAVIEAMKMEQAITAHQDGTVTDLTVETGATISSGSRLCIITPPTSNHDSTSARPQEGAPHYEGLRGVRPR